MAETIKIAELSIDNKKLIKSLSDTKKEIDVLTQSQKDLKKAGDTSSETFIKNEAALKNLKGEYTQQTKVLQATTTANTKLTSSLTKEIKAVDEASSNNKELKLIRNQLNTETDEGAEALEQINQKIDENNSFIEENASNLEKQKIAIGDYAGGIKEAANELNPLNGGLDGFAQRSKEAGGTGALFTQSLGGMIKGMWGMTKASIAFIATPVGAVLAAIVGAFALVKNAMNRSEESTNKIKKAFAGFSGIIKGLMKVLEPLGKFLIDGIVKYFDLVQKGVFKAITAIAKGLELLGFEDTAKGLREFKQGLEDSSKAAQDLAEAEAQLTIAQREAQKIQLNYQKDAEKLRQIRDDESLTMSDRIKANEDLGLILQEQAKVELRIANQALEVARLRLIADGQSSEALDEQAEALTRIAEIQERITSQESEQLVNKNSLLKEGIDKAKEIADIAIAQQEADLALFIAQQGTRAKTLEESLVIEREVAQQRIAILDEELKNRNITQTEYDAELLNIKNDLLQKQAELAVDNAAIELENYIQDNQAKLDNYQYFSDESLRIEQERLDGIAQKQRDYAALQLQEGTINTTEYNEAINTINEENRIANEEAQLERDEAQYEKDAIDFENAFILDQERMQLNLGLALDYLDKEKQAELANAELTGADKILIEEKYAKAEKEISRAVANNKLSLASDTLGNLVVLLGKESKAGKAVAVAQATITTFQSALNSFNSLSGIPIVGPALGAIAAAAAVASGLATVQKIVTTPEPVIPNRTTPKKLARGGKLIGASHSDGGIPFTLDGQSGFEAEGGETIINKKSSSMYGGLLSAINQAGGGVAFADGGTLGKVTTNNQIFDYDLLATKIAESNSALPAPIVAVDEINRVASNVSVIETTASF